MAERLTAAFAARAAISDLCVGSAGTRAVIGQPIHPNAALVLEELGCDASSFAARQLRPRIASDADLILTMTKSHRDAVLELSPQKFRRTFTLVEASLLAAQFSLTDIAELAEMRPYLEVGSLPEVPDPIGEGAEVYERVGRQIADLLLPIVPLFRGG